jgi:hypothetical protein
MTGRRFVSFFAQGAIVALGLALTFVGCSRQGEGERCDFNAAGDTDCDEGLVCVTCPELRTGTVDRCCPATPGAESDAACERADVERLGECNPTTASGGTTGSGGSAGSGGAGAAGGMSGSGQGGSSGGQGGSSGSGGTSGEGGAPDAAGAGGA